MKKAIYITEQQEKFLRENKGLLFEYYGQVSNPRCDTRILGNLQVWVYGNDRQEFTPHCHIMTQDKSVEFKVSLIDWNIINVKNGEPTSDMDKRFNIWLNSQSSRDKNQTNKTALYIAWDSSNPNNDLVAYCERHQVEINDEDLLNYIEGQNNIEEK